MPMAGMGVNQQMGMGMNPGMGGVQGNMRMGQIVMINGQPMMVNPLPMGMQVNQSSMMNMGMGGFGNPGMQLMNQVMGGNRQFGMMDQSSLLQHPGMDLNLLSTSVQPPLSMGQSNNVQFSITPTPVKKQEEINLMDFSNNETASKKDPFDSIKIDLL